MIRKTGRSRERDKQGKNSLKRYCAWRLIPVYSHRQPPPDQREINGAVKYKGEGTFIYESR